MNPIIIPGLLLIFVAWLAYEIKKSNRDMSKSSEDFWEKESRANNVRNGSLEDITLIDIKNTDIYSILCELTSLNNESATLAERILTLKDQPIANLTGITNTELKLRYGTANFSYLSRCDENYTSLVNLISRLGSCLIENNNISYGIKILEYGIDIGTDVSNNYILLADYYREHGIRDGIERLIISAGAITSIKKSSIIKQLNDIQRHM